MKKRVLILVSVLLLFTFIVNVYASENNSTNSEVDEIMFLAEDIVNEVNSVASEEGDTKTFTSDDILFKQATKVYVGLDIFKINNVSHNVNAALKDCPYIWIVPIQSDKKQIMVTVNQTSPFDKEKGIWKFGGISFDDVNSLSYMDYTETLYKETLKSDRQEKTVFYIGGIPNVRYPIGFVMTDKIEKLIFTDDPITSVKITSHARTQSIEKNKVYDYIDIVNQYKDLEIQYDSDNAGSGSRDSSNQYSYIVLISAIVVLGGIVVIIMLRKFSLS